MALTPAQLERLKRELVSWAFQVEQPRTVEAADQIIRTQIHPSLHETAHHLNGLLLDGGSGTVRRVTDHVGSNGIVDTFPQVEHVVDAYHSGEGDHQMLGHTMRELLILTALFHEQTLHRLFGALYALNTQARLQERFAALQAPGQHAVPLSLFAREFDEVSQYTERELVRDVIPRAEVPVPAVVVNVQDGDEVVHYNVPATVRVFDPLSQHHDIVIEQPQERTPFIVEQRVSIPWEQIDDGVVLSITMKARFGGRHNPHTQFIPRSELEDMRRKGPAIPQHIGRSGHIRLHPEYFVSFDGASDLPEAHLASLRARPGSIDITKHTNACELTIAV